MAQLPGIALRPQQGAPPSAAAVDPSDLGLTQAAENLQPLVDARRKKDEAQVQPLLEELAAGFGRDFEQNAARDDGTRAGFAKGQLDRFDLYAGEMLARRDGMPGGQAEALRRGVERQRLVWGQRAVEAETSKAGGLVADQERARRAGTVNLGFARYAQALAPETARLKTSLDGTSEAYMAQTLAAHDQAAEAALEGAPEAERPDLKLKLDGERLRLLLETQETQGKLREAVTARQAAEAQDILANSVQSDPTRADAALRSLPDTVADLPVDARAPALEKARASIVTGRIRGLLAHGQTALAVQELDAGKWDAALPPQLKAALADEARGDAGRRVDQALEAMRYGGEVDIGQAEADAAASGDIGRQQELKYRQAVGWAEAGGADGFGGGIGGFADAATFVIGLEGGATLVPNDNGRGPTRFGINSAANPGVDVSKLTQGAATQIYKQRYWQASGADRLPPDLALIQFDTAVNMGVGTARELLAASGGDPGRYIALRGQRYRELAKQPRHADDLKGWLKRLDKVGAEAARLTAFVNTREGLTSDPIKFAAKAPALRGRVPALVGEPGEAGWAQALQGRVAIGREISQRYRVPVRALTDGEAAFHKDRIAADPTYALDLARGALAAVGPQAARSILAEVGQQGDAGVHLHLADLYAMGLTGFAERAERGLALKGKGAKLDGDDAARLADAVEARKGVFTGAPERRLAVTATAEAAMLADVQAGKANTPGAYVNAALGAAFRGGRTFGGLAEINGKAQIIPHWLSADHAEDALEIMAESWEATGRGPVYTNGQAVPAKALRRSSLQLQPNGHYRILGPSGAALANAAGRPFEFDWDQARAGLRGRLGAAAVLAP